MLIVKFVNNLCACACVGARTRLNFLDFPVFIGVLLRSGWKSDGGTIVPPIFRQKFRPQFASVTGYCRLFLRLVHLFSC